MKIQLLRDVTIGDATGLRGFGAGQKLIIDDDAGAILVASGDGVALDDNAPGGFVVI